MYAKQLAVHVRSTGVLSWTAIIGMRRVGTTPSSIQVGMRQSLMTVSVAGSTGGSTGGIR